MRTLEISMIESIEALATTTSKQSLECVNWSEYSYKPDVTFQVGYNQEYIFVVFEVQESHLKAVYLNDNEGVCRDSCVEFFVKREDDHHYFNFEVNCIGTLLAAKRTSRHDATRFNEEQLARIIRVGSLPHQRLDNPLNSEKWSMTLAIPFDLIDCHVAPRSLMANFYKCGDDTNTPHFVSWAPIDTPSPDFHCPTFFGRLVLRG